jgi:hypothetical protein
MIVCGDYDVWLSATPKPSEGGEPPIKSGAEEEPPRGEDCL